MSRRLIAALALIALVALAGAAATGLFAPSREPARDAHAPAIGPRAGQSSPGAPHAVPPAPSRPGAGFRSEARLREHYAKHGREFGAATAADYLALARDLRDAPVGPRVLEAVRTDGVVTRYDRSSRAFVAFDADGTIRTFFKPRDGEAYFRRQLQRAGDDRH